VARREWSLPDVMPCPAPEGQAIDPGILPIVQNPATGGQKTSCEAGSRPVRTMGTPPTEKTYFCRPSDTFYFPLHSAMDTRPNHRLDIV
jgi:hypothetical protein